MTPTTIVTLPSDGDGEHDDAALDARAMLIDQRTQAVLVEAVYLARDELDAGDIDRVILLPGAGRPSRPSSSPAAARARGASLSSCSAVIFARRYHPGAR